MIVVSGWLTRVHHGREKVVEALETVSQSVLVLLSSVLPPSLHLRGEQFRKCLFKKMTFCDLFLVLFNVGLEGKTTSLLCTTQEQFRFMISHHLILRKCKTASCRRLQDVPESRIIPFSWRSVSCCQQ